TRFCLMSSAQTLTVHLVTATERWREEEPRRSRPRWKPPATAGRSTGGPRIPEGSPESHRYKALGEPGEADARRSHLSWGSGQAETRRVPGHWHGSSRRASALQPPPSRVAAFPHRI